MKSIAFFALTLVATAAMAAGPANVGTITISGTSDQTATVNGGTLTNTAQSRAYANQNVASNKGSISILGNSTQSSTLTDAKVSNEAKSAGDVAVQNLASNVGNVTVATSYNSISGTSKQTANVTNATMKNIADSTGSGCSGPDCADAALAYQNGASNMGDVTVSGKSDQTLGVSGSTTSVTNTAKGTRAVAVQNMSSNYGKVNILGSSTQSTTLSAGATIANLANGTLAHAYQNLASNDSCDPPPVVCVGPACGPYKFASN